LIAAKLRHGTAAVAAIFGMACNRIELTAGTAAWWRKWLWQQTPGAKVRGSGGKGGGDGVDTHVHQVQRIPFTELHA
jgi:hypothetical protein